jgi:flavin reductase (DIM6/NTAB) family NADH-FMN oxidoreductase RutF
LEVDTQALTPLDCERLINSLVVPRPIAWITTIDETGVGNLAPFSYFNVVSGGSPPVVMVSFSPKGRKDTLANLVDTGEFVVNIVDESLRAKMVESSGEHAPGVDEAALLGLATEPSVAVAPPRLALARAALECRTDGTYPIDDYTVAFGRVARLHVADAVIRDGRVDPQLLAPVGRLGGSLYTTVTKVYRMERPSVVADQEEQPSRQ